MQSIFTPPLPTSHLYKKRLKFYSHTAQVFRLLHGIYSTEADPVKQLHGLDSTSPLDFIVSVYADLVQDYCHDIQYDKSDDAKNERLSYQKISTIWRLLQVLYFPGFENGSTQYYGIKLMDWLNRFDKRAILQYDIQGVFNSPIPSRHASFWPMVYKLTLRGELKSLQQLIHTASERAPDSAEKDILYTMAQTIQSFPILTANDNGTIMDRRKLWKTKAAQGLGQITAFEKDRSTLVSYATRVIHIMLGDITTLCHNAISSVEATVVAIYYHNNSNDITIGTINNVARQVHQLRDSNNNDHDQYVGVLSLLKGDIYETLEQISQLDGWLLAHFVDILDEYILQHQFDSNGSVSLDNKPLYIHLSNRKVDARSFFVLAYAHTLLEQNMWETALDYMGTCGERGKAEINKVISQIPPKDNRIPDVIEYCTRTGLLEARQRLFENLGGQCLEKDAFVSALRYYYLAGNYAEMDTVFKTHLYQYYQSERELDLIDQVGSLYKTRCNGPYATFYFKYCAIVDLYKQSKFDQAAHAALDLLLNTTDAPIDLLVVFFTESITIFEHCDLLLPTTTTDQLIQRFMQCINNRDGLGLLLFRCGHDDARATDDLVTSLCDMYKIYFDRLSTSVYL